MARVAGKFPGGAQNLDAGSATGESSGGGPGDETTMNRGALQLVARQILAARVEKSKTARAKPVGAAARLAVCEKIARPGKVFVAWVEKRAYIRKCRTLFCGADLNVPREERNRLFSS
jgi:hypothetical protein